MRIPPLGAVLIAARRLSPTAAVKPLWKRLHPQLATVEDRNIWYLQIEIFWASFFGVAGAFSGAFAVRLGASDTYIGWLSSLPALLAILISLPAGRFLESRRDPVSWILNSLLIHRLGFLVVILVPWLVPRERQALALVLVLVGMSVFAHFFNVGFNALLADVIPERRRAAVFTVRNVLSASVVSIGTFLAGQWLTHAPFPFNYQVLYFVGLLGGLASSACLFQLRRPQGSSPRPRPTAAPAGAGLRLGEQWRQMRAALAQNSDFIRLNVDTLFYNLAPWTIGPLYILFFVRELGASDAWIGLNGTLANLAVIFGWLLWRRIMGRWGERKTLRTTVMLMGVYPLLVGLSRNLTFILFAGMFNNLIAPGVSLSHFNTLLKTCPPEQRNTFMAVHITLMNIGAFVCPFIGVALARHFGLGPTLIGAGLFWFLGASTFRLLPPRVPDTPQE